MRKFLVYRTSSGGDEIWEDWYYDGEEIPKPPCPEAQLGHGIAHGEAVSYYYIEMSDELWADIDLNALCKLWGVKRLVFEDRSGESFFDELPILIEIYDDYRE